MSQLVNFIGGSWDSPRACQHQDVTNPATGEVLAQVPLSTVEEADRAVHSAAEAFPAWRATPVTGTARRRRTMTARAEP